MNLKIGKIIGCILLCIFVVGISYILTRYIDSDLYEDTNILVTFEDTKEFTLESNDKLTKEEALKTYPCIFEVANNSKKVVKYQVKLKEIESNLEKSDLSYILFLNEKEVKSGKLSQLENNTFYKQTLLRSQKDVYKLYLYLNTKKEEVTYKYSLEIESK